MGDRYRIEEFLAQGGMGAIYSVFDEHRRERVALKRMLTRTGGKEVDGRPLLLFQQEYHRLVTLHHPRIIEVYDYGVDAQGPYYTMELLSGEDLHRLAPLPYVQVCNLARDVASSLAFLHAHRLVHRDVSPRNVRVTPGGRAKLLDFGALATFGMPAAVVGSPPCIPPEALHGALDGRADLYALGASMYWALTGRHAYPARAVAALPNLWKNPLIPPSRLAEVPEELDRLVLSLLSQNPLARPASAAEVMERLAQLAGSARVDEEAAAASYLVSPALAGRASELRDIRRCLVRMKLGEGGAVVIEGPTGSGMTRLMNEALVEAQLSGAVVLGADAEMDQRTLGLAISMSRELFQRSPSLARDVAAPHAALLSVVIPELDGGAVPASDAISLPGDAISLQGDALIELQSVLAKYWLDFARRQLLVFAIDNLHRADESSAAVFASIAKESNRAPLLCLATVRSGEAAIAPEAFQAFRRRAKLFRLGMLDTEQTVELVTSLFGDVAGAKRLAQRLYGLSGGNPSACVDLASHLVATGVVRYTAGLWHIPSELPESALPNGIDALQAAHLGRLDAKDRALAEALSVCQGNMPLELCIELAGSEERAFIQLQSLVRHEVVLGTPTGYRFGREALRQAVYRGIAEDRRRGLHNQVAEFLLRRGTDDPLQQLEAGWQLLRAERHDAAAELLGKSGVALMYNEQRHLAAPALEAAVRVIGDRVEYDQQRIALLVPLVVTGYLSDRELAEHYGQQALDLLDRATGLGLTRRLTRWLGPRLALYVGLVAGVIRYKRTPARYRLPSFRALLEHYVRCIAALSGVAAVCLNRERLQQLANLLEPLTLLRTAKMVRHMHQYCAQLAIMAGDRLNQSRAGWLRTLPRLAEGHARKEIPDDAYRSCVSAALFALGILEAFRSDHSALDRARELESFGTKHAESYAAQIRVAYHAHRGEYREMEQHRERVDALAVARRSTWIVEIWAPSSLSVAYARAGNVIGAKWCAEELERLAKAVPSLERYAGFARANYLLMRGDAELAIEMYQTHLEGAEPRQFIGWTSGRGSCAAALNACGRHAEARQLCLDTLTHLDTADREFAGMTLKTEIELALAESGLGLHDQAAQRVDALLAHYAESDSPLVLGTLHRARAEVAVAQQDEKAYHKHVDQMEQVFLPTGTPALIGQCERLRARGSRAPGGGTEPIVDPIVQETRIRLSACPTTRDRIEAVLGAVVSATGSARGYLHAVVDGSLYCVAPRGEDEPPDELAKAALTAIQSFNESLDVGSDISTVTGERERPTPMRQVAHTFLLMASDGLDVDGVVTLIEPRTHPNQALLAIAAQVIREGGGELWSRPPAPMPIPGSRSIGG